MSVSLYPGWVSCDTFLQTISHSCWKRRHPTKTQVPAAHELTWKVFQGVTEGKLDDVLYFSPDEAPPKLAVHFRQVLGRRLHFARLMSRSMQKEIERAVGWKIGKSMMSQVERGKSDLPRKRADKMALYFGCNAAWLSWLIINRPPHGSPAITCSLDNLMAIAHGKSFFSDFGVQTEAPEWIHFALVWCYYGQDFYRRTGRKGKFRNDVPRP